MREEVLTEEDKDRLLSKADRTGGEGTCWIWKAARSGDGYGAFTKRVGGRKQVVVGAHRASYFLHKGRIAEGLVIRHKCDTPLCINPEHMELGTPQNNVEDRVIRGRCARGVRSGHSTKPEATLRGEGHGMCSLSDAEAREMILERLVEGTSIPKLAKKYGIGSSQASRLCAGKSRSYLLNKLNKESV